MLKIEWQGETWQLDLDQLTLAQAVVITGRMGTSLVDWEAALLDASSPHWLTALQCGYWLMLSQAGQKVPVGDVDFPVVPFLQALAEAARAEQPAEVPAEEDPTPLPGPAAGTSDPATRSRPASAG
jgi:hypothetical protein